MSEQEPKPKPEKYTFSRKALWAGGVTGGTITGLYHGRPFWLSVIASIVVIGGVFLLAWGVARLWELSFRTPVRRDSD